MGIFSRKKQNQKDQSQEPTQEPTQEEINSFYNGHVELDLKLGGIIDFDEPHKYGATKEKKKKEPPVPQQFKEITCTKCKGSGKGLLFGVIVNCRKCKGTKRIAIPLERL